MLTTAATFREPWEAHMFCSRLHAEGVPAFVVHEYHVGNAWHYSTALGGVKVLVVEEQREEAKSIERRCESGEFRQLLADEFGVLDDIQCPKCGSHEHWKRRPLQRAVMAIALSFLSGVVVPPVGWVYFCSRCGTKFRQPLCPLTSDRLKTTLTAIACSFVVLFGFVLGVWALHTRYWFLAVVSAALLACQLIANRLSSVDNRQN